jgi:peptidyl-prolyl cis-trans isomerase C
MLRRATFAFALFAAVIACKGSSSSGKKGPVVAEGDGVTITADELKARLDEQSPMIRQSLQTPERKKQFLDNMLRFELLAKAAEKEGLDKDPDVQFTLKKVMVSKYYQRFFQDPDGAKKVPDADVEKYYDEHKDEFHRPARVHALHYFIESKAGAPDRAKKLATAKKLLATVLADEAKNPNALSNLARESSEDVATKPLGGDLSFKTQQEAEQAYGKELTDVLFKAGDNQTWPTVVEEPKGFHLVRVLQHQPEFNRALGDARPQIAAKLASQKKTKDFDDFVKKLRDDAKIKIDDAEVEKVAVAAPNGPPGGGMPGMMGGLPPQHPPVQGGPLPASHAVATQNPQPAPAAPASH